MSEESEKDLDEENLDFEEPKDEKPKEPENPLENLDEDDEW